ncbi:TPA: hypothetical protein DIV49_01155 [Candidatus Saccharibacteria bacterium]|nr:hypothetical protein [Candidatus Saccharibacteria bacterium]HRJ90933.1 prepilin-type N-terminal cleavage/methylation domain-containing protein [Candidatus Saccharibacteria bacterium]
MRHIQRGFSVIEVAIVLVVLGLVGALGYVAWNKFVDTDTGTTETSEERTAEKITVKNADDLNSVEKTLDATDVEDSESTEAEQAADF